MSVPKAFGFEPAKVGVDRKTSVFQVKKQLCIQIFSLFGATLLFLFMLLHMSQVEVARTVAQTNEQNALEQNEAKLVRVSGTEDALDAEAFQQQNLNYVAKLRSQNARMYLLLSTFQTEVNSTIDKLETRAESSAQCSDLLPLVADLRHVISEHSKKITYRLKEVRTTLLMSNDIGQKRLKQVDAKIEKLLAKTPAPAPAITLLAGMNNKHAASYLKHQAAINSWKTLATKSGSKQKKSKGKNKANKITTKHIRVALQKFSELKAKGLLKSALKKEHKEAQAKAKKAKEAAGAKRKRLQDSNRKVQAKLQGVFTKMHSLPNVRQVTPAMAAKWEAMASTYKKLLDQADGSKASSALLRDMSAEMTQVLKSQEGQRVVRAMYESKKKTGELVEGIHVDRAFIDRHIKTHPYWLFMQLNKMIGFTKGKKAVFEIERKLLADKIDSFQAWMALRKLMKQKLAPTLRATYGKKAFDFNNNKRLKPHKHTLAFSGGMVH